MKEYHVVFEYRPGTDTKIPEHVFVELEDETGKSISVGAWVAPAWKKGDDDVRRHDELVRLVLPAPSPDIRKALMDARAAIASLDVDALGSGHEVVGQGNQFDLMTWPLRNELLNKIDKALDQAKETT